MRSGHISLFPESTFASWNHLRPLLSPTPKMHTQGVQQNNSAVLVSPHNLTQFRQYCPRLPTELHVRRRRHLQNNAYCMQELKKVPVTCAAWEVMCCTISTPI